MNTTPKEILDLAVKFGVVPFLFYMIVITRQDVRYLQERLENCYEMQIPRVYADKRKIEKLVFILPEKIKVKNES